MKYDKNMTTDVIKIGEFENKKVFSYCVLQFNNITNIQEQGRIVECYFQDKNFLLIPRNEYSNSIRDEDGNIIREDYSTALLLLWTNIKDNNALNDIKTTMEKMLSSETNITGQGKMVLGDGLTSFTLSKQSLRDDSGAQYSYLISHRFINNRYIYKISSNDNFKSHFNDRFINMEGTVLDIVFTGRDTNEYHNCYNFFGYKIKDYLVKDNKIILSNVKGVIDLEKCIVPTNYVTILNLLQTWNNPLEIYPNYYSNMSIRIATLIPEDKAIIKNNGVYYNNRVIDSTNRKVMVLKDENKRYELLNDFFKNWNIGSVISAFISSKETLETLIGRFNRDIIEQEKENILMEREETINYIRTIKRQIADMEEKIILLEYRTKDFIPFPEIELPKKVKRGFPRIEDILRFENNKYIIREENNNEE